jgi:hypothetical protein
MRGRFAKGSIVGAIVVVLAACFVVSAASAKEVHILSKKFGVSELGLTEQSGVVVDQASENIYVSDTGHGRIAKFTAEGEPAGTLANVTDPTFLAVDNSTPGSMGDIYVVERGDGVITKLDGAGLPVTTWGDAGHLEGISGIAGIAVDPAGDLFVISTDKSLHEFDASGAVVGQCSMPLPAEFRNEVEFPGTPSQVGVAADSAGNLFFAYGLRERIAEVTPGCALINAEFGGAQGWEAVGVAVDQATGDLFSSTVGRVRLFAGSGTLIEGAIGESEEFVTGNKVSPNQLALNEASKTIYVAEQNGGYIGLFPLVDVQPPHVVVLSPEDVTGRTASFTAEVNPEAPESDPPAYDVNYSFHCIPECTGTEMSGSIKAGQQAVLVHAAAANLLPGTTYQVYVTAENVGGVARSPEEPDKGLAFTTALIPPTISEEGITEVSASSGTLSALLGPGGTQAHYRVEYVTEAQFEASEFAEADVSVEQAVSGGEEIPVSLTFERLSPATTYVARLVAVNTKGSAIGDPLTFTTQAVSILPGGCANEAFRVFAGSSLPDCRAYEQASPVDKNGGSVEAVPGAIQAAGDTGNSITFYSQAGIPGGAGAQDYPTFIATRQNESWNTQGLLPPASLGEFASFLGLTPDGRWSITEASHEGDGTGVFARNLETGSVETVVPYNVGCNLAAQCYTLAGTSIDGSRVFLETRLALDQSPPTAKVQRSLYVWERATGEISLVSTNAAGQKLPEGAYAGAYDWPEGRLTLGGAREHFYVGPVHAISPDGSQIVYTEGQEEDGSEQGRGQIYLRTGLGGPSPQTVKVSAYAAGREGLEEPAAFLEATPEGAFVFFMSKAELTSDSYAGEEGKTDSLYRYEVAHAKLVDLTTEAKEKFKPGPGVLGMLGASESGKVVYFASTTKLTSSPGPGGNVAQEGQANIYRWQEGAKPALTFVATVQNGPMFGAGPESLESDYRNWSPSTVAAIETGVDTAKTARVSANGNIVVFSSHRSLTGVPNEAKGCNINPEREGPAARPCAEFFRFSAEQGTLTCISCNPSGAQPLSGASIGTAVIKAADVPAFATPVLSRNLSENGSRFFFQTPDSLVSGDKNRQGCEPTVLLEAETCLDVYEWEAQGEGSCTTVTADGGCLYLISSGEGDKPSYFLDADPQGKNVFILTASQLVPADRDQLDDVYDAHEFGGLLSQQQLPVTPCGSQQSCQGQQGSGTAPAPAATSTFSGPGNPKLASCKKDFVRRGTKCVKKVPKKGKGKKKKGKPRAKRKHVRARHKRPAHDSGVKK